MDFAELTKTLEGQEQLVLLAATLLLTVFFLLKDKLLVPGPFLEKNKVKKVKIVEIEQISHDTKILHLGLSHPKQVLGLPVGKHVKLLAPNCNQGKDTWNGRPDQESSMPKISRPYTPISGNETLGRVKLCVKMYNTGEVKMPDGSVVDWANGGKMSGNYLDDLKVGQEVEMTGPVGLVEYLGNGSFKYPGTARKSFGHVIMLAGGTGLTPMLQVLDNALNDTSVQFYLIYAGKSEDDLLMWDRLQELAKNYAHIHIHYTLDFPPKSGWKYSKGFITQDMIKTHFPGPEKNPAVLMCGPPPMVEFACKKNLRELGYNEKDFVTF